MTTFTTEDRIIAEKDGSLTVNVEGGTVNASPPHIVDSGASVMNNKPVAWIDPYDLERLPHHDCWVNGQEHKNSVPLYTHPVKEVTDEEIMNIFDNWINSKQEHNLPANNQNYFYQEMLGFARAILKKARE